MGQGPSQELEQDVSNNPYVGFGLTEEEAVRNLSLCLKFYGLPGVTKGKRVDTEGRYRHGAILVTYFFKNGDNRIPIRFDRSESGIHRAYVAL